MSSPDGPVGWSNDRFEWDDTDEDVVVVLVLVLDSELLLLLLVLLVLLLLLLLVLAAEPWLLVALLVALVVVELNDGECVRDEDEETECSGGDLDTSSVGGILEFLDAFDWGFVFAMGDRGEFEEVPCVCETSGGRDS